MKEQLGSLTQREIEARIRGLQFQIKRSSEEDAKASGRVTRLALELSSRGIDITKRPLAVNNVKNPGLN